MSRRVLVTGSEGFTGKYVCEEFARAGWEVWGAGMASSPDKPKYLQIDLLRPDTLDQICKLARPDVVIHLAAVAFVAESDPALFYQVNVIGTRYLLETLSRAQWPPECTILASSANVYGNSELEVLGEDVPAKPANDYAVSKLAMEYMAKTYMNRLGIVVTRPFNYTGVGQSEKFLIPKIIGHLKRESKDIRLGNLHVERDYSDVRDIARYYAALANIKPVGETINLCSGETHSIEDLLALATQYSHRSIKVISDTTLKRGNEVHKLCGDPSLLHYLTKQRRQFSVHDTLEWMLKDGR